MIGRRFCRAGFIVRGGTEWFIWIHQYLVRRSFQVIKLPGADGPQEGPDNDSGEEHGKRDEEIKNFHDLTRGGGDDRCRHRRRGIPGQAQGIRYHQQRAD